MPPRPSRGRVRPRKPLPERCCARRPGPVSRFLRPRSPSRRDRGRGVANTETASTTQTTKRVVIERDIPEPAIAGLVEFIDRYYLPSKMRFIEDFSYRKTKSADGFELFWKLNPAGPQQARPLPVALRIAKAAIELDF